MLVKSYQTEHAARQAGQLLSPHGVVVTLQNGLGNLDRIAAVVGADRATLGVTAQGAMLMAPGVVQDTGAGPIYVALPVHAAPLMATGLVAGRSPASGRLHRACGHRGRQPAVGQAGGEYWPQPADGAATGPQWLCRRTRDSPRRAVAGGHETAAVAQAQGIALPYAHAGQYALEVARATAEPFLHAPGCPARCADGN